MDELEIASMVGRLMRDLQASLTAALLPENTQVVIRPIYTWPDGRPTVWVTVNTSN